MTGQDLAAELAAIRERRAVVDQVTGSAETMLSRMTASLDDVPRLLAVVEALLAEHHPVDRRRVMPCCDGCEQGGDPRHCVEWDECPVLATITRELAGEDDPDAR